MNGEHQRLHCVECCKVVVATVRKIYSQIRFDVVFQRLLISICCKDFLFCERQKTGVGAECSPLSHASLDS